MSSTFSGMDQAAPGTAYNCFEAEQDHAAGRRWHQLVAIYFGGTQESRVDASDTHRRRARDDERLGELMVGAQTGDKASYARLLRPATRSFAVPLGASASRATSSRMSFVKR